MKASDLFIRCPLSPLLSNIVLDALDKELEKRGLKFVRYADDCVFYVGSKRAGGRVMKSMTKFVVNRLAPEGDGRVAQSYFESRGLVIPST